MRTKTARIVITTLTLIAVAVLYIVTSPEATGRVRPPIKTMPTHKAGQVVPVTQSQANLWVRLHNQAKSLSSGSGSSYNFTTSWPELPPNLGRGTSSHSIDLSSSGNVPPPGSQYPENSCVAWSVAYGWLTYSTKADKAIPTLDVSRWDVARPDNEFSPSFTYNLLNGGRDNGVYLLDVFNSLFNVGSVLLPMFNFSNNYLIQPSQNLLDIASNYKLDASRKIAVMATPTTYGGLSVRNIINSLRSGHTVVIAIHLYFTEVEYGMDNGGNPRNFVVDTPTQGEKEMGYHSFLIVGYDDKLNVGRDGVGAFKVLNSWGTDWGNGGYAWLSFAYVAGYGGEAEAFAN